MLSLPRYILSLVLWLSFFFNVERLYINKTELIDIARSTYFLVTIFGVLGVILPQWRRIPAALLLALASLAFAVTKLLYNRPYWGDGYTYVTLFELTAVLLTVTLAHRVGQLTADFGETLRTLLFSGLEGRIHPAEQAEVIVSREMQSARRGNHALSLLLIEPDTRDAKIDLTITAQEIQRLFARRLALVSLTRLFAANLRGSDSIVDDSNHGRWLLMTSEVQRAQTSAILKRLNEQTTRGFGIKLRFGVASYPEQGLTFEDLVAKAEQDLRADPTDRRNETDVDPVSVSVEEPGVKYSSYETRTDASP